MVGAEAPREHRLAVVVVVRIAHGDFVQLVPGDVAQLADDDLEFRGVFQGLILGLGAPLFEVRQRRHALGDVCGELVIAQDQQVFLSTQPRRVEGHNVFRFEERFEFGVEVLHGLHAFRELGAGLAVQVNVRFLLRQGVECLHGAVEEVNVPGVPRPCRPSRM